MALVLSAEQLAVIDAAGTLTVKLNDVVRLKGDPVTVMLNVPVGVWALVPIVKVEVHLFSVGSGEQDVGEKLADD